MMNQQQIQIKKEKLIHISEEISEKCAQMLDQGLNPCDHCENLYWITGENVDIETAKHMVETNVLGKRIMMELCDEHYLEYVELDED